MHECMSYLNQKWIQLKAEMRIVSEFESFSWYMNELKSMPLFIQNQIFFKEKTYDYFGIMKLEVRYEPM